MSKNISTRLLTPCIILLLLLLAACHNPSPWGRQGETADSLIEQHPDSVLLLLQDVDYNALDEEGQAHYGLLLTAARYKLYQPVDTTFINRSIAYYNRKHDWHQFATSLYYKGVVLADLGDVYNAARLLKESESYLKHTSDVSLSYKIHENLTYINFNSNNGDLALQYARLLVKDAQILDSLELTVDAYDKLSGIYTSMGMHDSASFINKMNLAIIDSVSSTSKSYALPNIASNFLEKGQYGKAKELLLKSLAFEPDANAYFMLARIAVMEGDERQAQQYLQEIEKFDNPEYLGKAYLAFSDIESAKGQYEKALLHRVLADSLNEMLCEKKMEDRIAEVQLKYDKSVVERQLATRTVVFLSIISTLLFFVISALVLFVWRIQHLHQFIKGCKTRISDGIQKNIQYKAEIYRLQHHKEADANRLRVLQAKVAQMELDINAKMETIEAKNSKMADMTLRIGLLEGLRRDGSRMVEDLKNEIASMQRSTTELLGQGRSAYQRILSGKGRTPLTNEELHALVAYYTYSHYDQFSKVISRYKPLPTLLATYLVLVDMGISNSQIQEILCVEKNTVRGYRFRLKKYEKS